MGHSLPVPACPNNKGYLSEQGKPVAGETPGLTDLATQPTYTLPSAAVLVATKWPTSPEIRTGNNQQQQKGHL